MTYTGGPRRVMGTCEEDGCSALIYMYDDQPFCDKHKKSAFADMSDYAGAGPNSTGLACD